jgi:hypothetical protein
LAVAAVLHTVVAFVVGAGFVGSAVEQVAVSTLQAAAAVGKTAAVGTVGSDTFAGSEMCRCVNSFCGGPVMAYASTDKSSTGYAS